MAHELGDRCLQYLTCCMKIWSYPGILARLPVSSKKAVRDILKSFTIDRFVLREYLWITFELLWSITLNFGHCTLLVRIFIIWLRKALCQSSLQYTLSLNHSVQSLGQCSANHYYPQAKLPVGMRAYKQASLVVFRSRRLVLNASGLVQVCSH